MFGQQLEIMGEHVDVDNVSVFSEDMPAEAGLLSRVPLEKTSDQQPEKKRRTGGNAKKQT